MKTLLFSTLLFSATGFAQTLDVAGLKSLLTARQATLESVKQGMSKKVITTSKVIDAQGACDYTITSIQTILKIEGANMIVHTNDKFAPAASAACTAYGYQPYEENILFYQSKPLLADDLAYIDQVTPSIKSIVKDKEIVTMSQEISGVDPQTNTAYLEKVTIKYDLAKPSFKNVLLTQGTDYKIEELDSVDVNVNTINLKKVLFCDNNDGDNSECAEGDYSDILFN